MRSISKKADLRWDIIDAIGEELAAGGAAGAGSEWAAGTAFRERDKTVPGFPVVGFFRASLVQISPLQKIVDLKEIRFETTTSPIYRNFFQRAGM